MSREEDRVHEPSEENGAIVEHVLHPDGLVQADGSHVLGAHEETDGGNLLEQQAEEIAQRPRRMALPACGRIDPHLLQLDRGRRPRGRLRLEPDHTVLLPDPRATVLDLGPRSPAEALWVATHGIDAELLGVRGRAGGQEELEVAERGGSQTREARLGWRSDDENRLLRTVLAWSR